MARSIERLSPAFVRKNTAPGMYADGANLWLHVGANATEKTGKSWIFRYMVDGKARSMGLGATHTVGLARARELAKHAREQILAGADPLAERERARQERAAAAASLVTFQEALDKYTAAHDVAWKTPKFRAQWKKAVEVYACPTIGKLAVGAVTTGHMVKILEPIWRTKPETATRVRARVAAVLDYARVRGWRTGDNSAQWRGHLSKLLPDRGKVSKVRHHPALPWREAGAFMVALRQQGGNAARALELAVLTAARTGEVIGATWGEIDLTAAVWTVPADRMKAGRQHRVPLSKPALVLLGKMAEERMSGAPEAYLFPGAREGSPLSNMALIMVLRRMARTDITPHGFRSCFRDWVREATAYPAEVAEAALAHTVGDKTVAAYARGDLFEKRRRLMDEWADFCGRPTPAAGGDVVPLRAGVAG